MNDREHAVRVTTVGMTFDPLPGFVCGIVLRWKRVVLPVDLWLLGSMYSVTGAKRHSGRDIREPNAWKLSEKGAE